MTNMAVQGSLKVRPRSLYPFINQVLHFSVVGRTDWNNVQQMALNHSDAFRVVS